MYSIEARDGIRRMLDELEVRIVADEQHAVRERIMKAATWQEVDRPPIVVVPPWESEDVATYHVAEALEDPAKMLYNELAKGIASAFEWLDIRDDRPLQIRPDFGTGLASSVLGARIECPSNNPPWVHPLSDGDVESNVQAAIDNLDLSDIPNRGLIPRVAETYGFYAQVMADYPNARSSIATILPDMQGPFDTAAMLWGSYIFEALYTNPELVDRLCSTVADVMIALHDYFRTFVGRELLPEGFSHTHGVIIRGNYLMRGDSNLMLSNAMYREKMLPHELKVLRAIGGGSYHSCGRWEHNIWTILALDEVGSLDFGSNQSQMNDIDRIYRKAAKGKKHLNLVTAYPREVVSGSVLRRFPTGATLSCEVENKQAAERVMREFERQAARAG